MWSTGGLGHFPAVPVIIMIVMDRQLVSYTIRFRILMERILAERINGFLGGEPGGARK